MTDVTVLVPTVGRSEGLRRLCEALAVQEDPGVPWDVLVVDNATPPRAAEIVTASALPVPARVVHEPRAGAAHARNRGVAEVASELVALLDDDVVPDQDWLRRLLAPLLADPGLAGVGATVRLDPTVGRPAWLDDALAAYLTDHDLGEARDLDAADYLLTANAAFRTAVLREVGFDPRLGPRPGVQLTNDDLDLTRRTLDAGHRLRWNPDAVVVHDLPAERTRLTWFLRRLLAQGRSDWLLDEAVLRTRRAHGLRAAVWDVVGAPGRWRGRARGGAYVVHVLGDAAHGVGFAQEAVRAMVRGRRPGEERG